MRWLALVASGLVSSGANAQVLLGPLPYLSLADSPFDTSHPSFAVENFEDGILNIAGVTTDGPPSFVLGPGGLTDSVDADDGQIDGLGQQGWSFFHNPGAEGITFDFNPKVMGGYPTHAGIVWTDGEAEVYFQAFGPGGELLGTLGPVLLSDGSYYGTTADDRFFGAESPCGIARIKIWNLAGGIEVDHLQISFAPVSGAAPADLNGDGHVNAPDLASLLGAWGPCPGGDCCAADLTGDGDVSAADLAVLLGAWTG